MPNTHQLGLARAYPHIATARESAASSDTNRNNVFPSLLFPLSTSPIPVHSKSPLSRPPHESRPIAPLSNDTKNSATPLPPPPPSAIASTTNAHDAHFLHPSRESTASSSEARSPSLAIDHSKPLAAPGSPYSFQSPSPTLSSHSSRPDSPSHKSVVRFDEAQALAQRPSKGSLRPQVGQNGHHAASNGSSSLATNAYQPAHPSLLHTSIVPSPPRVTSPTQPSGYSSNSGLRPFPQPPLSSSPLGSPSLSSDSHRPPFARAFSSQERRVLSEALPTRSHRSGSVIARGQRPSRVTGGFESTSDEGSDVERSGAGESGTGTGTGTGTNTPVGDGAFVRTLETRRRAKSLGTAVERHSSEASTPGLVPGTSTGSGTRHSRRSDVPRPKKRRSKDLNGATSSRGTSTNKPSLSPSRLIPGLPNSRSEGGLTHGLGVHGRTASSRSHHDAGAGTGPTRQASVGSSRVKGVDRVRQLGERTSSPEGMKLEKDKEERLLENENRKGKGKEGAEGGKGDDLAASLGLGISTMQDKALNTDQLHTLLNDPDLTSALRTIQNSHLASPRASGMDPYGSFNNPFSPHSTTPTGLPPSHTSPYLVSAPPALTAVKKADAHGRDRALSTASTVSPHMRMAWSPTVRSSIEADSTLRRQRSGSRASMSGEGGHVPFTHHLPIVPQMEEVSDAEESTNSASLELARPSPSVESDQLRPPAAITGDSKKKGEKKGGLGHLFHFGRRKSSSDSTVVGQSPGPGNRDRERDHRLEKQRQEEHAKKVEEHTKKAEEQAREKARLENEQEIRRIERERREEELEQERRYRVLNQIAAHPAAERRAYKASSHLRAYYHHVYECIDNPPRLNFTKMLRWLRETDEQNARRAEYYESQRHEQEGENGDADVTSAKSDRSGGIGSPRGKSHWGGMIHQSPGSLGSRVNLIGGRKSLESGRSTSLSSSRGPSQDASPQKKKHDPPPRGWKYTVDDIQAFRDCRGVVNYFVPLRQSHPDVDVMTEDERPTSPGAAGSASAASGSRRGQGVRAGMSEERDRDGKRDETSSLAGSSKRSHPYEARVRGVGTAGAATASNLSLLDWDGSVGALSRTASIETGSGKRDHRLTHRSHHSLGAVGQTSITHALKQPFEKLSGVKKKQRTMPLLHTNGGSDIALDNFAQPDRGQTSTPQRLGQSNHPSMGSMSLSKLSRGYMRASAPRTNGSFRDTAGFFRRHGAGGHESTDDEGAFPGKRKLFIKGHRLGGLLDDVMRRSEVELNGGGESRMSPVDRDQQLKEAEVAYAKEQRFKANQLEADEDKRRTRLEMEALEKINDLEEEMYAERAVHLSVAKERLEIVSSGIDVIDDSIRHYLAQMDYSRDEARIGWDLDTDWSLVDPIRARYNKRRSMDDLGEHRDTLPPLRSFGDSGSDAGPRLPPLNRRIRSQTQSQSNSGVSTSAAQPPKRKMSFALQQYNSVPIQTPHRPRRTYLAPDGMSRVDPVKQAEMVLQYARDREHDMEKEKADVGKELEKMISQIEAMIRQKEEVRHWARDAVQRVNAASTTLETLRSRERSVFDIVNGAELRDPLVNGSTRLLGLIVRCFWPVGKVLWRCALVVLALLRFAIRVFCLPWTIVSYVFSGGAHGSGLSLLSELAVAVMGVAVAFFWYDGMDSAGEDGVI